MSYTAAERGISPPRAIDMQMIARRIALFMGILMSGGLLIFPRPVLLAIIAALAFFLKGSSFGFRREMGGILLFLLVIFAVSLLGAGGLDVSITAIRFANFLVALPLLGLYGGSPRHVLSDDLYFILKWMAVQSILTVVISIAAPGLFGTFRVNDIDYRTILYLFNYHEFIVNLTFFKRPDGLFYEPGVYQIYLNIFLYLTLFVKRSKVGIGLAIAAVFATQSTTGVLIAVILISAAALELLKDAPLSAKMLLTILAPVLAAPFLYLALGNVDEKMNGQSRGSFWARQYDLYSGMNVAINNPLVGIGFEYERYHEAIEQLGYKDTQLDDDRVANRSNSNGIVTLFFSLGFPISFLIIWAMFFQRFFERKILFAAIIFPSMMSEALLLTPFFLMLIYSGLLMKAKQN